jgi:hypothetical protein
MVEFKSGVRGGPGEGWEGFVKPVEGEDTASAGEEADVHTGTELEFVIMVIAVSCVKLLSAHNSTQHTSRKHKV